MDPFDDGLLPSRTVLVPSGQEEVGVYGYTLGELADGSDMRTGAILELERSGKVKSAVSAGGRKVYPCTDEGVRRLLGLGCPEVEEDDL